MTVTAAVAPTAGTATWRSLHCYTHWTAEQTDGFLLGTLAPTMAELRAAGQLDDWFFIRHSEGGGPHLRVRARGCSAATMARLAQRLAAAVRQCPHGASPFERLRGRTGWRPHGEIRFEPYQPEIVRYGGPDAIATAEDVFCRSSELALDALAQVRDRQQRLTAAIDLTLATAAALDLDELATARWLSSVNVIWRWHRTPEMTELTAPAVVQASARAVAADKGPSVVHRWQRVQDAAARGRGRPGRWAAVVRGARELLEVPGREGDLRWQGVWASQLHMLCNRLGLLPHEEQWVNWFVAESLTAPQPPPGFFADAADAADRRYLAASRYVPARIEVQQPRTVPTPRRLAWRNPHGSTTVDLPAGEPAALPLDESLRRRVTSRGRFGGEVTLADLGTLLGTAFGPHGDPFRQLYDGREYTVRRRPFPSAGSRYVSRLRLVAWRVSGLEPGLYDVDEAHPRLHSVAPAPTASEVVASSMWFVSPAQPQPHPGAGPGGDTGTAEPAGDRIDVSTLPALAALYVDLAALRAAYGLRATRFALLEAGHLAQNLALVAAATGLSLATIGGFYDDIAHELFMLDGLDDLLVYLLPIGRTP